MLGSSEAQTTTEDSGNSQMHPQAIQSLDAHCTENYKEHELYSLSFVFYYCCNTYFIFSDLTHLLSCSYTDQKSLWTSPDWNWGVNRLSWRLEENLSYQSFTHWHNSVLLSNLRSLISCLQSMGGSPFLLESFVQPSHIIPCISEPGTGHKILILFLWPYSFRASLITARKISLLIWLTWLDWVHSDSPGQSHLKVCHLSHICKIPFVTEGFLS